MSTPHASRTYAWVRTLDHASMEHAVVERRGGAHTIRGDILAAHDGKPLHVTYELVTDAQGISRSLSLQQVFSGERRRRVLVHSADGWSIDGRAAPELAGCLDIDIGLSPATNALPIARMTAGGVERADVCVAWVRFPSLDVVPATQRYTRVGPGVWRYESITSGFSAQLHVDDWLFPEVYDGVWKRVAVDDASPVAGDGFAEALVAAGPSPELGEHAKDFDWLVGGWDAEVRDIAEDGSEHRSRGEWWFAWVLEGRALQDVWISPPRAERAHIVRGSGMPNRYGTTIRRFDRDAGAWRIVWINPASGAENVLTGVRQDNAIVLLGTVGGQPIRWQFTDIADDGFTWQGYRLARDGVTWRLESEFVLRRRR